MYLYIHKFQVFLFSIISLQLIRYLDIHKYIYTYIYVYIYIYIYIYVSQVYLSLSAH